MFKLVKLENKIVGFKFLPTLEIGVGIFIAIACLVFTLLWLWFNRHNLLDCKFDLVLVVSGLIVFGFISFNLIRNYIEVKEKKPGVYNFFQCSRYPDINFDIEISNWIGTYLNVRPISDENKETLYDVYLSVNSYGKERDILFYYSTKKTEAEELVSVLQEMHHDIVGDINK